MSPLWAAPPVAIALLVATAFVTAHRIREELSSVRRSANELTALRLDWSTMVVALRTTRSHLARAASLDRRK